MSKYNELELCEKVFGSKFKIDRSGNKVMFSRKDLWDKILELQENLNDAEEHIDSLELQLREQYQLADEQDKQLNNAIVPKFKIGQEVWYISLTKNVCEFKIEEMVFTKCKDGKSMIVYYDEHCGEMYEYELFATREDAEKKLKELRGE